MPAVTVLMSVYNGAAFVGRAVESILDQTCRDFEFLIIDDASRDDTARIVEAFADPRIRLLRNARNLGLTASLNRGLREARGELIARQDADDLSHRPRLERQLRFLRENPACALVGSQGWVIDERGRQVGRRDVPLEAASVRWASFFFNPLLHSAVMFRRRVFLDDLGGYDESFTCCQDYELWARAMQKYPLQNLPERLVGFQVHGRSISATRQGDARRLDRQVLDRLLDQAGLRTRLSEEEISLLARVRMGLERSDLPGFEHCLSVLREQLPDSPDARRTLAVLRVQLGYALLAETPMAGLREITRGAAVSPRYGLTLPWLKIAALALLGDTARRIYTAVRGA